MSSNNTLDDADLKSRLAHYGIIVPITNTTRAVLRKKLHSLETSSSNEKAKQSNTNIPNDVEEMDTTTNDLNEYEMRDALSKLGYSHVPLTNSTRPTLSKIIRKKT